MRETFMQWFHSLALSELLIVWVLLSSIVMVVFALVVLAISRYIRKQEL